MVKIYTLTLICLCLPLLVSAQKIVGGKQGQITIVPKGKVNLLEKTKPKHSAPTIVPEKVNLLARATPHTFGTIKPDFSVVAPWQLAMPDKVVYALPKLTTAYMFCDTQLPIHLAGVTQRLAREFVRYKEGKGAVKVYANRMRKYQQEITQTLEQQGLPQEILFLAVAESGLANVTSPKGAKGFWQFMPETAKEYGLEVSATVDERLHPQKSTLAACKYLKFLYQKFQNWPLAAAAYNMGEGGVQNALQAQGRNDYFSLQLNPETAQYLYRIVALKYVLTQPQAFGLPVFDNTPIPFADYWEQPVNYAIEDLSVFASECGTDVSTLKAMNPWLIGEGLHATQGKTYLLRLPNANSRVEEELLPR